MRFLILIWTLSVLFIILKVLLRSQLVIDKPTCIDIILTNPPWQFQATLTLEIGLSDFHKMTVAAFNSELPHKKPKMISYRNYKHFDRSNFEKEIKNTLILQKQNISLKNFSDFKNIVFEALNLYALLKTKYLLENH